MWTAITAAIIMGGIVWVARIAAATVRERERAEDVAELAEVCRQADATAEGVHARLERLRADHEERILAIEGKVAALVSAQAVGRRR